MSETKNPYVVLTVEEATTPPKVCGLYRVMTNRYWRVNSKNELLFYKSYDYPQCNSHKVVTEQIKPKLAGGEESSVLYLPCVYVPHECDL